MTTFHRFAILLALCLVAVLLPTAMYAHKAWAEIGTAAQEDRGIAPSLAVLEVMKAAHQHRGLSRLWGGGKGEPAEAPLAKAL